MLTGMNRITQGLRSLINTLLLVSVVVWILDLPASFGYYLYNEQFLALAAGLGTASVLLATGGRFSPFGQWLNLAFTALVLILFGYVARDFPSLQLDVAAAPPQAAVMGTIMVLAILEGVRRKTGLFLPILVALLVVFAFIGPYLPADYQTRPVSFSRVAVYLSLDTNALLSTVLAIASIVVAPFILFGFLLNTFGGSAVFSRFASKMVGHYTGGPAKVSVIGSGAFGMVSGSAVANVVAVGSVTIPTMVRAGYSRPVAAAVEAVSSTGGQLVPPIMGASAFLMAELLEIQYQTVAIAAIVPSILFYLAVLLSVDFEARRLNIKGDKDIDLDLTDVASDGTPAPKQFFPGRYLLAALYLIYLLFVENRSAEYAGLMATGALIALHMIGPLSTLWFRIRQTFSGLLSSVDAIADIIVLAGAAGLVIGILNLTGVAFAITLQMLALSGGNLAILLVITAILSIVLGLGMPTVGVYILLATLAAPALVMLDVVPLAAHLYVLYFGMLSMITPPIAIASFAAASVANTSPWQTAFASLKIGAGVYLVPLAFVVQPSLLFAGGTTTDFVTALVRIILGIVLITIAAIGYLRRPVPMAMRVFIGLLSLTSVIPLGSAIADSLLWASFALGIVLTAWLLWPVSRTGALVNNAQ